MTIASTATVQLTVDELITLAFHLNGFGPQPPTAQDLDIGRKSLLMGLTSLANGGVVLRQRERATLTTVASQAYVDCPSDTLSVEKDGVVRDTAGTDIGITMRPIAEYLKVTNKTTTGMPSFYYPEQQTAGTWRVYFWPVPDANWPTFIVPRTRRARDVNTGNLTLDFDERWQRAVVLFMQAQIMRSKGKHTLALPLLAEYEAERERAMDNETERGDATVLVASATPWG